MEPTGVDLVNNLWIFVAAILGRVQSVIATLAV